MTQPLDHAGGAATTPAPRRIRALLADRTFGPWFVGNLLSNCGNWLYNVVAAVVVSELTGSAVAVGMVSVAQFASLALLSPWAGSLSDRCDRRRLLLASQAVATASATAIAVVVVWVGTEGLEGAWPIILATAGIGVGVAFAGPAQQALVPALVDDVDLEPAVALTSLTFNVGRAGRLPRRAAQAAPAHSHPAGLPWPPTWRSRGHEQGHQVAAYREIPYSTGRSRFSVDIVSGTA